MVKAMLLTYRFMAVLLNGIGNYFFLAPTVYIYLLLNCLAHHHYLE